MMQRPYYSLGLFLTTLFSLWLVWHYVIDFKLNAPSDPNTPDQFANNVRVKMMSKTGEPQYEFSSPLLHHYSANDRTAFETPNFIMYQDGQPPWKGTAKQGEAIEGDSKVTLTGDVFFHQAKGANNAETSIQTQLLVIYPETKIATSPDFVLAVQPYATASGIGMKLDVNANTLDLLSEVHGMYLPQPPQKGAPMYVTSNSAHLDKTTDIVTFIGDAKLKQGPNSYAAPKIEYHIKQRMAISPESNEGRTTIIIQPDSLKKGKM
ncbi:MAG TPA: LPS export ABC transporter periplasmic protein LptC [Gammaproteobacteria bacterium]|nr:LPS export ABC transporter periplasmic protein LptC [Gammaproteobacteria bacterium]